MEFFTLSKLIAIVLATILQMVIGASWYTLFGRVWALEVGYTEQECRDAKKPYALAMLVALVISIALTHLVQLTGALTWEAGACLGFWCWLGFVATTHFSGYLWAKKPLKVYLIDVGCLLISLVISGALIAAL